MVPKLEPITLAERLSIAFPDFDAVHATVKMNQDATMARPARGWPVSPGEPMIFRPPLAARTTGMTKLT
jgi:hypothetical protein